MNATRDDFGNFAKFIIATVANGKVYVPTMSKTHRGVRRAAVIRAHAAAHASAQAALRRLAVARA
jgi:hypothetical protein